MELGESSLGLPVESSSNDVAIETLCIVELCVFQGGGRESFCWKKGRTEWEMRGFMEELFREIGGNFEDRR